MSASPANQESPRIILPSSKVAFSSIDQRDRFNCYSIVVAVQDDAGMKPLKSVCDAVYIAKFGRLNKATAVMPYKAPDAIDEDLAGTLLVSAKSKRQPRLIDRFKQPVADTVLLRGDLVMVSVVPYAWTHDGRTGVTLQIRSVLLVERGEVGHIDGEKDFDDVEVPEPVGGSDGETPDVGEADSAADGDPAGEEF